jgi:hypothetical protein
MASWYNPKDYTTVATLWYTADDPNNQANLIKFNTDPENVSYSAIKSLTTGPDDILGAFVPLGNKFTINYCTSNKLTVTNNESPITKTFFDKTFKLNVPNGFACLTATYPNPDSDDPFTDISQVIYTVIGGTGIFNNTNVGVINYDNDGSIWGKPNVRQVLIQRLK